MSGIIVRINNNARLLPVIKASGIPRYLILNMQARTLVGDFGILEGRVIVPLAVKIFSCFLDGLTKFRAIAAQSLYNGWENIVLRCGRKVCFEVLGAGDTCGFI